MLKKIASTIVFFLCLAVAAWAAKTVFIDGDPATGTHGTRVTAAFLNAMNNMTHHGTDADGDGPQMTDADIDPNAAISKSKIATAGTWTYTDLPATTIYSNLSYSDPGWITSLAASKINGSVASAATSTVAINASGSGTALYAAETGLSIIRGAVSFDGLHCYGGGFSCYRQTTGTYFVSFNTPFNDSVVECIATPGNYSTPSFVSVPTASIGGCEFIASDFTGTTVDREIQFIAIAHK